MNIFKKLMNKMQEETIVENVEKDCIYSPIEGEVIPLKEIPDEVFSEGMMGKGCGIKPSEGKVYAPFDGEIILIANTKHAIALKSSDGIELLIHVGMDTVKMNGNGFNPIVKVGDRVKCGQLIMEFSVHYIEEAGYDPTAAIIVTNFQEYANVEVLTEGIAKRSEKIIKAV